MKKWLSRLFFKWSVSLDEEPAKFQKVANDGWYTAKQFLTAIEDYHSVKSKYLGIHTTRLCRAHEVELLIDYTPPFTPINKYPGWALKEAYVNHRIADLNV